MAEQPKVSQHHRFPWIIQIPLIFFKIFGLATFNIKIKMTVGLRGSRLTPVFIYSRLGCIYNLVFMSFFVGMEILGASYVYQMEYPHKTILTQTIDLIQWLCGLIVVLTSLVVFIANQKTAVKIGNRLSRVDQTFFSVDVKVQQRFPLIIFICLFVSISLFWMHLFISEINAFKVPTISIFTFTGPGFLANLLFFQYILVVKMISNRFDILNRAIADIDGEELTEEVYPTLAIRYQRCFLSEVELMRIARLRDVHLDLCQICRSVSDYYSIPTLFNVGYYVFALVYNAYYIVSPIIHLKDSPSAEVVINVLSWAFIALVSITFLSSSISTTVGKMHETANVVNKVLANTVNQDARIELQQFSLQLLHRNTTFTACGMFSLDRTLVQSVIATTITYLMIFFNTKDGIRAAGGCNCTFPNSSLDIFEE
ncbi:putative gustatory receptor 28a [Orussus abietinus]|uniref:putative gustatory receptor 28a n=1 Tax=Orussus abietinus TaxID=222816 RepID=UPI000625248C|nr:putative gustatory receptor 28a [Orussus abietinus]